MVVRNEIRKNWYGSHRGYNVIYSKIKNTLSTNIINLIVSTDISNRISNTFLPVAMYV